MISPSCLKGRTKTVRWGGAEEELGHLINFVKVLIVITMRQRALVHKTRLEILNHIVGDWLHTRGGPTGVGGERSGRVVSWEMTIPKQSLNINMLFWMNDRVW
jgi:hypothetical protein